MADLQCAVRNPGCRKTASYVCHHCGRLICSRCDREMVDRQFAVSAQTKKYPKAHHCPDCYHPNPMDSFLRKVSMGWLKRFFRQVFS
jgi:DNA-directed RNA polymerase subunit RPC12/RpoP